jgi:hypothetical protein
MVRAVLGRHSGGLQIALDNQLERRCAPTATELAEDSVVAEVIGRVIVRHRTRTGVDADGVPEYDWVTAYDGPGVWSAVTSVEDDDGSGAATETATVAVPDLADPLATTATVWDTQQYRWVVTGAKTDQAGGVLISVTRRVDGDT